MKWLKKTDIVKCDECKHLVSIRDAQRIAVKNHGAFGLLIDNLYFHYCPMHRKKYDRVIVGAFLLPRDEKGMTYLREMLVDKNGIPLGYEKVREETVEQSSDGGGKHTSTRQHHEGRTKASKPALSTKILSKAKIARKTP